VHAPPGSLLRGGVSTVAADGAAGPAVIPVTAAGAGLRAGASARDVQFSGGL
jgi:hypothetical protein